MARAQSLLEETLETLTYTRDGVISELMMKSSVLILAFLLLPLSASAQRLPSNAVPSHYEIAVAIDLAAATFTGDETIRVHLQAPSESIVLNAAEIAFNDVSVTAGGRTQKASVKLDESKDQAMLTVPSRLPAGDATLHITYAGRLNDDLRGLYLSKANNRRYAVTQMEATDARRMFPGFDEPSYKATFDLKATIDEGDHAISNGAIVSDTPGPGAGKHTVTFATTPKMSTYLLALAVGDFVCNEGAADGIPIRICSTPDKKALTGFALESARQVMQYYNRYYSIKYPFKKLDVVAVPDFAAGAMENTAAIFYRETLLLADDKASVGTRKSIAEVLAHEMAHQWFGDLVTMQWWDDLWLNEGFANWMQSKPVKAWKPEWQMELGETASNQAAMSLDALHSTRAVRAKAETPAEINELFDSITYEKGAAILRMVEAWVGEEPFRKGVNAYLEKFKYGNARAEDFWSTVASSTDKPVDKVMASFVDQPGVPLVSVALGCEGGRGTATLTQERYVADQQDNDATKQLWQIPVCMRLPSGKTVCDLLDKKQATISAGGCQQWTVPNAGARGYYRTALPPASLRAASAEMPKLEATERLALLGDEWALVRGGRHDIGSFLDLASGFGSERSGQVLNTLTSKLAAIDDDMTTDKTREPFRAWIRALLAPVAAEVGWGPGATPAPKAGDGDDTRALRAAVVGALGVAARDPNVLKHARPLVEQELDKPGTVDPTLLGVLVNVAPLEADATLYDKYVARSKSAVDPEERYRYLYGLASFADPALVRRTVEYAIGPDVRSQDTKILLAALLTNDPTQDLAWDLMRQQWDAVQKKTGEFVGNTVIVGALAAFCDDQHYADIKSFFAAHPVPDAARTLAQSLEAIASCSAVARAQSPKLEEWLQARGSAGR
jgi:puromycin-sensitive aminopeptidase